MAASYPGAVKSFTTRIAGQTIQPAHVNDLQDETAAVEGGLLNGVAHDLKPSLDQTFDLGESGQAFSNTHTVGVVMPNGVASQLTLRHGTGDTGSSILAVTCADAGGSVTRALAITGDATIGQDVASTGSPQFTKVGIGTAVTAAESALVAGTTTPGLNASGAVLKVSGTLVEHSSGTHALLAGSVFSAPSVTVGAGAVTNAATVYVADQPAATVTGANYAFWVDAGIARFDGQFQNRGVIAATLAAGANNDFAPTGLATCNTIDVTPDAGGTSALNGFVAQPDGTTIYLRNVHASVAFVINGATGSSASNQFAGGAGAITVNAGRGVAIQYCGTLSKWVALVPA